MTTQPTDTKIETHALAIPQAHYEACLERAGRGLCEARGVEPESMQPYDSGTTAYTMTNAWRLAAEELRQAHLIAMFVRTLP